LSPPKSFTIVSTVGYSVAFQRQACSEQNKELCIDRHRETTSVRPALFSGSIAELLHPPASQIPFLDGLRSIAILLVVSGHLSHQFAETYGQTLYSKLPFVANGWIGVDLFSVLSGFFIGGQLWKELRARKTINVGRFIIRRGFRIWPLYFFTFLCVLLFALAFGHDVAAREYGWSDVVFVTNFYNRGLVMGSWSLCTEEQFYIVAPLALFFFARHVHLVERCRPWLWGLLLFVPVLRAAVWMHVTGGFFRHDPGLFSPLFYCSLTHCDGLIVGLIIANLWVAGEKRVAGIANPWVLVAVATTLLIVFHVLQKEIFDFSVLALFFGSFVWLGLQRQIPLFNSRIFYWISRLSFGMYLNHEYMCPWIVHTVLAKLPLPGHLLIFTNLAGVVIVTILSAAIALVTFCFVEHPFLQMRKAVLGRHSNLPTPVALSPVSD
jgi:peptidoglycan/LPS O-acetylase OafA/YrhL